MMVMKRKSWKWQKFKEKPFLEPRLFDFNISVWSLKHVKKHAIFDDESIGKRFHWSFVGVPQFIVQDDFMCHRICNFWSNDKRSNFGNSKFIKSTFLSLHLKDCLIFCLTRGLGANYFGLVWIDTALACVP